MGKVEPLGPSLRGLPEGLPSAGGDLRAQVWPISAQNFKSRLFINGVQIAPAIARAPCSPICGRRTHSFTRKLQFHAIVCRRRRSQSRTALPYRLSAGRQHGCGQARLPARTRARSAATDDSGQAVAPRAVLTRIASSWRARSASVIPGSRCRSPATM